MPAQSTSKRNRLLNLISMTLLLAFLNLAAIIHIHHVAQWPPMAMALGFVIAFAAWHLSERLLQRIFHGQPAANRPTQRRA